MFTKQSKPLFLGFAVVLFMLGALATSVALAASVPPTLIPGASNVGKTCADVAPGTTELKVEPAVTGVYTDGTLSVTVTRPSTLDGPNSFDWTSNVGVDVVIVKDGVDGANVYTYDPPTESTADTDLRTPNAGDKGISHISFCYDTDPNGGVTEASTVTTEVHLGGDHATNYDGGAVPLASFIHDKVIVSTATNSIPAGSSIDVSFFTNSTCTLPASTVTNIGLVGGATSETVDPASPQGPLASGDYSYNVHFNSGDTNSVTDGDSLCEIVHVDQGTSNVETIIHEDVTHAPVVVVPLATSVHDTATILGVVPPFAPTPGVLFFFYPGVADCSGPGLPMPNLGPDPLPPGVGRSVSTGPLAAGLYSYNAVYPGDANYLPSAPSPCEPLEVLKADSTIATQVHDPSHTDITNTSVVVGTAVHDSASVGTQVGSFSMTGTVTYYFYNTIDCTGISTSEVVPVGSESTPQTPGLGPHSYSADYSGDINYNGSSSLCEPFRVIVLGKTMGFWGNNNGNALLIAAGGLPVTIGSGPGRSFTVTTIAQNNTILPSTLNACAGSIFNCASTGVSFKNANTLNTLAAQTLALTYNINLISGYTGQTIGDLGCSSYITAPLTALGLSSATTVDGALAVANTLIANSKSGGSTTQARAGAMNSLLGCLNREAP